MEKKTVPRSRKASRSRSSSRAQARDPPLNRILSGQFPDDHSVYHHEEGEGFHVDQDADLPSSDDDSVNDAKKAKRSRIEEETYEHDVEALSVLEKAKSTDSVKDPDLVSTN